MRRNVVFLACAMGLLLLGLTSCQKIEGRPGGGDRGPLVVEMNPSGDAIPLAYGDLVGITPDPMTQWQAVLWFEGPDRTVTAVWVNTAQRRVVASLKIPRR